jgi:hypothetical protein
MVKVATTKAQRKLFFNLRSMKQGFKDDADAQTHRDTLTDAQIDVMARELNVKREEVIEMETRMSGGDVMLDPGPATTARKLRPDRLPGRRQHEPTAEWKTRERDCWPPTASPPRWNAGSAQPPHRRRALAEGQRRRLRRHDAARTGRRVRRVGRAHPPDRSRRP